MGILWLVVRSARASGWLLPVIVLAIVTAALNSPAYTHMYLLAGLGSWLATTLFTAFVHAVLLWTHAIYDAYLWETLRHHPRSRWIQYSLVGPARALNYAKHAGTEAEYNTLLARKRSIPAR